MCKIAERIIDRRGRRHWDAAKRDVEDRRMCERRAEGRRRTERRAGERRGNDLWANDPSKKDRRIDDRRKNDRRSGDRRNDSRRNDTTELPNTVRAILGERLGTVFSLPLGATLGQAAGMLASEGIGIVVVVTAEGALVGVLSERDIVRALAGNGAQTPDLIIDTFITRGVWACAPDDSSQTAMNLMHEHRMRHLPVIEMGRLVGMVSASDLISTALNNP